MLSIGQATSKLSVMLLVALYLTACQSIKNNETSFKYRWNEAVFDELNPKRIIISHVNLGTPSRNYLRKYETKIDSVVKDQLETNGFQVVSQQSFKSIWRGAVRKHGEPYDLETGQRKPQVLEAILFDVISEIKEKNIADAVLFTDLIERDVFLTGRSDRKALWDGVSRTPRLSSPGGVSEGFDWNQPIAAASVMLVLYGSDQSFLFQSAGGLELTRAIDTRSSSGRLVRRKELFTSAAKVKEGVAIALHPLVELPSYTDHAKK